MYRIKKINPLSLGYTASLIYLAVGILFSIVLSVAKTNPSLAIAFNSNLLSISYYEIFLLYPVAYTIGGFVTGIVIGFLYNFVTKFTGGISIELSHPSIKS